MAARAGVSDAAKPNDSDRDKYRRYADMEAVLRANAHQAGHVPRCHYKRRVRDRHGHGSIGRSAEALNDYKGSISMKSGAGFVTAQVKALLQHSLGSLPDPFTVNDALSVVARDGRFRRDVEYIRKSLRRLEKEGAVVSIKPPRGWVRSWRISARP